MRCLFLVVCMTLTGLALTSSSIESTTLSSKASKITMQGNLVAGGSAKSTTSPLEVYQDDTHIGINFHSNLGNLYVVIVNQYGYPVYQKQVNATNGSNLTISTSSFSSGSYTIYIGNSQGYMEGEFEI